MTLWKSNLQGCVKLLRAVNNSLLDLIKQLIFKKT